MTMPSLMGIPRVLLWIESSNSYGRRILYGIGRRIHESRPWSLFFKLHGQEDQLPAWVTRWRGEGILARTEHRCHDAATSPLGNTDGGTARA